MKFIKKIKAIFTEPPVWEMSKDFKVEWRTNYGEDCGKSLEKQLSMFNHKIGIFSLTSEVYIRAFLKKRFKIQSNEAYVEKLKELVESEIESYLLDTPRDTKLAEEISNIKFLGGSYDPSYNYEMYISVAKARGNK